MATVEDILLPDIGDFSDVEIIEILVAPGDRIEAEQSILTLESDKATIEIPSPLAGVVETLEVQVGDRVSEGSALLKLATPPTAQPAKAETPTPASAQAAKPSSEPAAQKAKPASRRNTDETLSVVLPDMGDFTDIPVIEILVKPGDRIEVDQSLLTLESDKATMEIPSPYAGIVGELTVAIGDTLNAGDLILTLHPDSSDPIFAEDAADTTAPDSEETETPAAIPSADTSAQRPGEAARRKAPVLPRPGDMAAIARGRKAHASPAVRRFARELGVELGAVKGSGPKGRIIKEDVQAFIKDALSGGNRHTAAAALPFELPAAPEIDYSRFGEIELVELQRIRKLSGRHLHRAWLTIPHVTQFDEADITELEAFRTSQKNSAADDGVKLTFMPFLLKAVATALGRMPHLKASLTGDGERMVIKHFTHIGVAVDTPNGLVVPVIRDVDKKGIYGLAKELAEVSDKARAGRLLAGDMQGGCFTISSLGAIGGTAFTPIVNAPEVAILGVSRAEMKPVWDHTEFVPRLMLPLSLSYDHRVVDGADGVRFTALLSELLKDIRRLLL